MDIRVCMKMMDDEDDEEEEEEEGKERRCQRWQRLEKAVEEVAEKAAGESGRRESGWRKLEEVKKRKRLEKAVEDRLCCLRRKRWKIDCVVYGESGGR